MLCNGELVQTATQLSDDLETLLLLVAMGTATFCGISLYMVAVHEFSGVTVVAVATLRKVSHSMLSLTRHRTSLTRGGHAHPPQGCHGDLLIPLLR